MSSALVRQALALVDPEDNIKNKKRRRTNASQHRGQVPNYKRTKKQKQGDVKPKSKEEVAEENIQKLLALSTPTASSTIAKQIVERAIKGKPLCEKVKVKEEEQKSILFPDEPFEDFEKTHFCKVDKKLLI